MKKIKFVAITTFTVSVLMYSCNSKPESQSTTPEEAPQSMIKEEPAGLESKIETGKVAYEKSCQTCHQADGKGLPGTFPPLANSDYLAADLSRAISGVVNGLSGEITVNGEKYNQVMPKSTLTDEEIADAFTYVLNSFGNKGGEVKAEEVKAARK
jgi:nitrite reductase (NO-forming)